jgi:hypothetical protein
LTLRADADNRIYSGFGDGASRARTGDLLGAIQATLEKRKARFAAFSR